MSAPVRRLLCADAEQRAMLVERGLDPALLEASWLTVCGHAQAARDALAASPAIEEAIVLSSEEVEGINLAAALKVDAPACRVYLAACEETGSVRSRLTAACLDGVLSPSEVVRRLNREISGGGLSVAEGEIADGECDEEGAAGFLLTVVGGSGGAGKSTVATALAHGAARRGLRCAMIDADLQFGDLGEIGAADARVSLDELVEGSASLPEVPGGGVALIGAPSRPELAEVLAESLDGVVQKALARFDFVVVDAGGGWNEQQVRLLERSAAVVFLVDQRASSVRACRRALDLCLRCGVATSSFVLALNRCGRHAPFSSVDVSSALEGAPVIELADGGREVEELLGAGLAPSLFASGNDLCASVNRLLSELLPRDMAACQGVAQEGVIARLGLKGARVREKKRSRRASRRRSQATRDEIRVPLGERR